MNINFDVPDITKNVREFLDKKIRIENPFKGLKPGQTLEDIAEVISENQFVQDLGKSIGGVFESISGFGKQIPRPQIDLPFIDLNALGDTLKGAGTALSLN